MAGILEQVKAQAGDNLSVVKIDTEKYPQIASQWQIAALPTIMLFHQGQPVDRIEGVMQAPALLQRIQSRLGEAAIR
jgi:thioredoxin-like negative regulator of GroEL